MPPTYDHIDLSDTARWAHDDIWDQQLYEDYCRDFLGRGSVSLAFFAMSPAAASDLHSDEYSLALLHALAHHLVEEACPFE